MDADGKGTIRVDGPMGRMGPTGQKDGRVFFVRRFAQMERRFFQGPQKRSLSNLRPSASIRGSSPQNPFHEGALTV